jgi:chitodextrinase
MKKYLPVFICLIVFPGIVFSATSSQTIRLLVGEDLIPPTVPTGVSAIPVSDSQIQINWSPATDNYLLSGYVLFRDDVAIATTTLTSFIDSGLLEDTVYSYVVQAFDSFYNYSSSSISVATSTLKIVVPPEPPPIIESQPSGGSIVLQASAIQITTTSNAATFSWNTQTPSQFILKWGRTDSYEMGSVVSGISKYTHQTVITGLVPATRYFYELTAIHPFGVSRVLQSGQFTTKGEFLMVENVLSFTARAVDNDVALLWFSPRRDMTVRIVRSYLFFPQNIYDGLVVYEGDGGSFLDTNVLGSGRTAYYTIFVLDPRGAHSSGVVAKVIKTESSGLSTPTPTDTDLPDESIVEPDIPSDIQSDETAPIAPFPKIISGFDIFISQAGQLQTLVQPLSLNKDLVSYVFIPVSSVPKNLKSITVTVYYPFHHRQSTSYLMKISADGARYEAVLPPIGVQGESRIVVDLFDYELVATQTVEGLINWEGDTWNDNVVWIVILGINIFLLLYLLWRVTRSRIFT